MGSNVGLYWIRAKHLSIIVNTQQTTMTNRAKVQALLAVIPKGGALHIGDFTIYYDGEEYEVRHGNGMGYIRDGRFEDSGIHYEATCDGNRFTIARKDIVYQRWRIAKFKRVFRELHKIVISGIKWD